MYSKNWLLDGAAKQCAEFEQNCLNFVEYFTIIFVNALTKYWHFETVAVIYELMYLICKVSMCNIHILLHVNQV